MAPKRNQSLWMGTSSETNFAQLKENIIVDVIIVGGGIAGLNAAYFLKQKGLQVAVIEAKRIAEGTTGYTTAKVTSLHDIKYTELKKNFGKEHAQTYADSHQWAVAELEKIIKKENITCDFQILPSYTFARKKESVDSIKEEVSVTQDLGLPAAFVRSIKDIPFLIQGAICFEKQATFHPRKYLISLAKKIDGNNSYIFENTRAIDVEEGELCSVKTDHGNIKGKYVIIATNFPFYDKGMFFARMSQIRSYAMAVKLNTPQFEKMLVGMDEEKLTFKPHTSGSEKWMIVGGGEHTVGQDKQTNMYYKELEDNVNRYLDIKSIEYKWSAQDSSPVDKVPYIGLMPQSKYVYVTTGYGEWGMTTSFVSAKLLTDLITTGQSSWKDLYNPSRIKPLVSVAEIAKIGTHSVKGLVADRFTKNSNTISGLKENEGKVISRKGEKIAVYKDTTGKTHAVSAVCTHMGCIVDWNTAEKSWDCPCHGSRFTKEGRVIEGPAVKDLPKRKL